MNEKLDLYTGRVRNVLFCLSVLIMVVGLVVSGLCLWLRFDTDFRQWVDSLQIQSVYIGAYILIISSLMKIGAGVFGCIAAIGPDQTLLYINCGVHIFCLLLGLAGAAVLMDYTSYQSTIYPVIQRVMLNLISRYPLDPDATNTLLRVQEEMGCCGAQGPNDYLDLRKAVPPECRDTVTGNAFFYGCADELTWYLEQRSAWITGLALALCSVNVVEAVLSLILAQLAELELQYIS